MTDLKVLYSPIGVQAMQLYRARMEQLVNDKTLTRLEAEILITAKMNGIIDKRA